MNRTFFSTVHVLSVGLLEKAELYAGQRRWAPSLPWLTL
jgi:hypothetical protein